MRLLRGNTLILLIAFIAAFVRPISAGEKLRIGYGAPSLMMCATGSPG